MIVKRIKTAGLLCALAALAGCEIAPPAAPSKHDRPSPAKNVVFTAPAVKSISVGATRVEVDQDVVVSATVDDAETPASALVYQWSATIGTLTGSGAQVTWRLPKGTPAITPADVVITLTVVERYAEARADGSIVEREHRATASAAPFRVHDSVAELGRLAVTFLVDLFGNSAVAPAACLVDFSDTCESGKEAELSDIIHNRATFVILSAQATVTSVVMNAARTEATVVAACTFQDRAIASGAIGTSSGDCILTAIYEAGRWWLCTSNFSAADGAGAMFERYRVRRKRV
jgi:hypothetical protein